MTAVTRNPAPDASVPLVPSESFTGQVMAGGPITVLAKAQAHRARLLGELKEIDWFIKTLAEYQQEITHGEPTVQLAKKEGGK